MNRRGQLACGGKSGNEEATQVQLLSCSAVRPP